MPVVTYTLCSVTLKKQKKQSTNIRASIWSHHNSPLTVVVLLTEQRSMEGTQKGQPFKGKGACSQKRAEKGGTKLFGWLG